MRVRGAESPPGGDVPLDRFVGRVSLRNAILASAPRTGVAGSAWLLSGPAGIGKTSVAAEVAADAGARVAWGRSWDAGTAPAYWPWTQVVRTLLGAHTGTELGPLVLDEPAPDRFELFDAVAGLLRAEAVTAPLTVILDDLHDADEASLLLTRFVWRQLQDLPVLLLATSRPIAADDERRAEHFDALRQGGHTVELAGLDPAEVGELVGESLPATEIHAVTSGNPMLVRHVAVHGLHALGGGATTDPGQALRAVVASRLRLLSSQQMATVVAIVVLSGDATLPMVGSLLDAPEESANEWVKTLIEEGVVAEGGIGGDQLTLEHPLFTEIATRLLPDDDLARLHHRAAQLGLYRDRPEARAYHLLRAGADHVEAAQAASREAADRAVVAYAHEEAASYLRRALDALAAARLSQPRLELELTLSLGRASWRGSERGAANDAFDRAWELAFSLDDPDAMARAALRGGIEYYFTGDDGEVHARRDAIALERLSGDSPDLRARLLADIATKRLAPHQWQESRALASEAVAIAREAGSDYALGHALAAENVTDLHPVTLHRRMDSARELLALARRSQIHDLEGHGRFLLMGALLEHGDIRGLDSVLADQDQAVDQLAEPWFDRLVLWFRCMRALLDGRPDDAVALASDCHELAQRLADPDGFAVYVGQVAVARWMQGRLDEMEPLFTDMQQAEPHEPLWGAALGLTLSLSGHLDAARGKVIGAPDVDELPDGQHWLLTVTMLAESAALVGELDRCAEVREALLPYADRVVPIAMGASCWTVVARPLGLAAIRLGELDEGIRHLQRAVDVAARLGAMPWLVEAQLDLAEVLIRHDRPCSADPASLIEEARSRAVALGLGLFVARADALIDDTGVSPAFANGSQPGGDGTGTRSASPPGPQVSVLGTFEVTDANGVVAAWKSRKARELLKLLVARRGGPVRREEAMDLLWPDAPPADLSNRLSVALSTVRRALDPDRASDPARFVTADKATIRLRTEHVTVDSEEFLTAAGRSVSVADCRVALDGWRGEALPDEPYADWARPLRSEVNVAVSSLARRLASHAIDRDDPLGAVDAYRYLLVADPYDETAHLGTVDALLAMGAHGQAARAYHEYRERLGELGIDAAPPPDGLSR